MGTAARLTLAGAVCAAMLLYLAYLGFSTTWQYYVLVDECGAEAGRFSGKRLRVSGKVAPGTLAITEDRRQACFHLVGDTHRIPVRCAGPLPDNLAECIDVVVEGILQEDGQLQGHKVITRCASKYAPKGQESGS